MSSVSMPRLWRGSAAQLFVVICLPGFLVISLQRLNAPSLFFREIKIDYRIDSENTKSSEKVQVFSVWWWCEDGPYRAKPGFQSGITGERYVRETSHHGQFTTIGP